MGRRREKIYEELVRQCSQFDQKALLERSGITASDISKTLDMLRSNVSSELNELVREKRVIKFITRPVLYVPAELIRKQFGEVTRFAVRTPSLKELLNQKEARDGDGGKDPFSHLIGAAESLQNSVRQAKSAIMYPPRGLHTLILGATGSGKTLFAHMMYNYAKTIGRINQDAPFVDFNCADYYNNPQLLIGQLFGFVKGAFTGADHDQEGLVAKADGGILFLDEIHRLPPEGQEMIFYFMDNGRYSKLGESGNKRLSHVLIIGATTADPESALLQTFLRRVPVMINIPSFQSRSVHERIELTKFLLSREAHRTSHKFHVSADVMKALIGSVTFGNIGQLKSNVQLVCAQGFLDSMNNDYIQLDAKMLPTEMREGLHRIAHNPKMNQELNKQLPLFLMVTGKKDPLVSDVDQYEPPFDLYKMISGKFDTLTREGLSVTEIRKFIAEDIKGQVRRFYQNKARDAMNFGTNSRVLSLSKDLETICSETLGSHLSHQFVSLLTVHLSSFLEHPIRKLDCSPSVQDSLLSYEKKDYDAACAIADLLKRRLGVELPEVEIMYVAFLLNSFVDLSRQKPVGIVVAAHGEHTASSMVGVVQELMGDYPIRAVDMPLNLNFNDIFDDILKAVGSVNQGAGVLMMVDMGSLYYFEDKIAQASGVRVKAIDMVSTPMILDAVKNANYLHMDLKDIVDSLNKIRGVPAHNHQTEPHMEKAILTICTTGSGIARRIKNIVATFIRNVTDEEIMIIPISIEGLYEHARKIREKYRVVASIGAKNPKLEGVPYITLSQFVSGEGQEILQSVLTSRSLPNKNSPAHIIVKGVCEDSLQDMLMYLNPKKAVAAILAFNDAVQKALNIHFKNATQIRLIMHLAFALERDVAKSPLKYEGRITPEKRRMLTRLRPALEVIKFKLNIQMSEGETYYFIDMLADELGPSILSDQMTIS
ncbi:sigma-54-dependent transcriptional regulator [Sporolactobacillus sp. THM19-2]|jgi:transcriptional regulatory protein LevR/transcriptional regulator with AAA-type ATPase domain|uniref:sigma-54-dependent transcriptional regulator n=1 Tax=Sporolactobacillus sp. THM19-2 TaxID=2511171 RepID=UPI001020FC5F|nr:sigma-54-dependent transcriptional regulator [Sporolactobacillus sp. THM19-2]RYL91668.1 sigma-54-dependent transcriptional regulator [Sporolactobacillus sp. THM19-2]